MATDRLVVFVSKHEDFYIPDLLVFYLRSHIVQAFEWANRIGYILVLQNWVNPITVFFLNFSDFLKQLHSHFLNCCLSSIFKNLWSKIIALLWTMWIFFFWSDLVYVGFFFVHFKWIKCFHFVFGVWWP